MDKRDSCNYRKASQFREVAGITINSVDKFKTRVIVGSL